MVSGEYYNNLILKYKTYFSEKNTLGMLKEISLEGKMVFSTSFGKEDQVITDLLVKNTVDAGIFTIDTGRLFNETYSLHRRTNDQYRIKINTFFPDTSAVEKLVNEKGPDSFFDSVENRIECCHIRKVEPLARALKGADIWVTGLRHSQSPDRNNVNMLELDPAHNVVKFHPLINWNDEDVENYISSNKVPVNSLHAKGFPSIGCAPCTRAVLPGEDSRAGRWYWEQGKKECGLHVSAEKK